MSKSPYFRLKIFVHTFQTVGLVDPVGNAGQTGGLADHDGGAAAKELFGVEDVVYLRILHKTVCVNTRSCNIKVSANEWSSNSCWVKNSILPNASTRNVSILYEATGIENGSWMILSKKLLPF